MNVNKVNKPPAQWLFSDIETGFGPTFFLKLSDKKNFYQQMSRKWFFAGSAVLGVWDRHRGEQKTVSNESVDSTQLNSTLCDLNFLSNS